MYYYYFVSVDTGTCARSICNLVYIYRKGKNAMYPALSVPAFYSGKSVFITGATGFLGKALIEKLLRSCPNIKEIFLLMRAKNDTNIDERLRQLLTNPLFDTLRHEQPHCFDKLIPVEGDLGLEGLGLSAADRDTLIEKTSVIFHGAASVKFDNTLRDAVITNVRSTRDICILSKQMKNLAVLIHISTAYTQVDKPVVDEIVYPGEVDWKKTIRVVEALDEGLVELFKSKYIGTLPNHYIFSKKLAEQVIIDYSGSLPCVICRPSIVTPMLKDPLKGWLDNFNGPVAMYIASGKGILKLLHQSPSAFDNYVPIDIVIKALIVAASKHGSKMINTQDNLPAVYNCTGNHTMRPGRKMMSKIAALISKKIPYEGMIWAPGHIMITNPSLYQLLMIVLIVIPSCFIDGLLRLSGRQPRLLKLQRNIFITNRTYAYFTMKNWEFRNEKMSSLSDELSIDDQRDFGYTADLVYDKTTYVENNVIGSKIYLLNESMDRLDAAKLHYNRMIWIDRIVKVLAAILFMGAIYGTIV
ncbi:fatty acyl-CoA reductase 1-like [Odontomachus brunneus]|uniref:fatty acyl-CoA reductase 1-like n=1 Tax=Odontomachus brunneus TaxID=486640 RepID=UPI0013F277E5|nr:fatty acyl-CoA reductase 1-like [Odontomachus brunneus]